MDVLIAGGGVAGLSAGIALTEAGHRVTISERARELRAAGAALSIWPNALAALDILGVGDQVRAIGIEAHTDAVRTTAGDTIIRLDGHAVDQALGGMPVIALRAGLQKVLLQRAEQLGIEIRLGQRVDHLHALPSRVEVGTGGDKDSYDAVIGADGINSRVRQAIVTRGALRDCHRLAWRALIPNEGFVSTAWLTVGVGLQVIASPAPEGQVYWAADAPRIDGEDDRGDPRDLLRRYFGDWHDPIPALIEATPPETFLIDRLYDWPRPDTLRRGRLLLVGDAAHPMTPDLGQGACQAIEDAAVLLATATAHPGLGPVELFERFERTRLPRVRTIVRDSYLTGRLALVESPLGVRARDVLTRLTPERVSNRRLAAYASAASFERHLARI